MMAAIFLLANVVRWWVIRTLGAHWNVRVVNSVHLGVVSTGPFRFVRHPNYAAVFVELFALPLIHLAWITATLGSLAHVWVLSRRLALEETVYSTIRLTGPSWPANRASCPTSGEAADQRSSR